MKNNGKRDPVTRWYLVVVLFSVLSLSVDWAPKLTVIAQAGDLSQGGIKVYLPIVNKSATDLAITAVKVIQGSSLSEKYKVHIADRTSLARVFISTGGASSISPVTGKMCAYDQAGNLLGCISPVNGPMASTSMESNLNSTLNFNLPSSWLKPGYGYQVELFRDGGSTILVRYPASGREPFQFVQIPPLKAVIVPVVYQPCCGSTVYSPRTDDLSYLTHLPVKLLPVPAIQYTLHLSYTYAPSSGSHNLDQEEGWAQLLMVLTNIHASEDKEASKNYYGVVNSYDAHGCSGGCITGVGWIGNTTPYRTAAGWSGRGAGTPEASKTMVHEMGHNFGRSHVTCLGNESGPDLFYPYPGGSIGQFGLDLATGLLYDPAMYADFMSYCEKTWTSDYTYWNIYNFLATKVFNQAFTPSLAQAVYVSGIISPEGEVSLMPVYRQAAKLLVTSEGTHTVELLGAGGEVLAVRPFTPAEIADLDGYFGFGLFLPDVGGVKGVRVRSGERVLTERFAQDGFIETGMQLDALAAKYLREENLLKWVAPSVGEVEVFYRLRVSTDGGGTWQVLAVDWSLTEFTLPEEIIADLGGVMVEVQASDGVQTSTSIFVIGSVSD